MKNFSANKIQIGKNTEELLRSVKNFSATKKKKVENKEEHSVNLLRQRNYNVVQLIGNSLGWGVVRVAHSSSNGDFFRNIDD